MSDRLSRQINLALVGVFAVLVCSSSAAAHDAVTRCHTATLSGHLGFIQGAAGSRFGPVVLTNRSHNVCTLEGYIGGQLYSAAGGRLPTRIVRDRSRPVTVVTLRPGRRAFDFLPVRRATLDRTVGAVLETEEVQRRLRVVPERPRFNHSQPGSGRPEDGRQDRHRPGQPACGGRLEDEGAGRKHKIRPVPQRSRTWRREHLDLGHCGER